MNKIIREHYPVEKLPEDLRVHFADETLVTIEVVAEDLEFAPKSEAMTAQQAADLIRKTHQGRTEKGRTIDEIAAEVRGLRDEWND